MVVHLFCNESYGQPYLEAAAVWAHAHDIPLHAWHSSRAEGSAAWRRRARARMRRWRSGRRLAVPLRCVPDVNAPDFLARIAPGDVGAVAGFDQIFASAAIARFASLVNFHPSLLPFYRGPVPSHWCLEHGEQYSGFTLHRVAPAIDAGEILHQRALPVGEARTAEELDSAIARAGARCLVDWLAHVALGAPFVGERVDAAALYRVHDGYRSFPRAEAAAEVGGVRA